MKETGKINVESFQLSKYKAPDLEINLNGKFILNGENNSYFKYIKNCYDNSTTNAAIINSLTNYIVGEGLIDSNSGIEIKKILSKSDLRLLSLDYKTYGGFAVQVLWNAADSILDKKPVKIKYVPIYKIGLNINEDMEVNGYWYSFDWERRTQFAPKFFHKFDGKYKGDKDVVDEETDPNIEILMVQRPSSNDFFSNPDYQAGLVYAEVENELSNSTISHIQNGFQGGAIINMNGGVPPTEELKKEYKKKIIGDLTGSSNTNKVIVSFNENAEQAMTIDRIDVAEINAQYESFDETAERKLIVSHSVPPILFSGSREGNGMGNNAEEIQTATQSLYRKVIDPMREVILEGLQSVFNYIDPNVNLEFKNFDSFVEEEAVVETKSDGTVDTKVKERVIAES